MVYTNARTVDMGRATPEEIEVFKGLFKVQYEDENRVILYHPVLNDKLYLLREKLALRGE